MVASRSHFIQGIPRRFIQRVAQKQEVIDSPSHSEERVASRHKQHQEGEADGLEHPHSQSVGLHVMDGDERFVVPPHKLPTELKANAQARGQTWLHRGGDGRELAGGHAAPLQSLLDHLLYVLSVKLLGHGRIDATAPAGLRVSGYKFRKFVCVSNTH